MSETSETKGRCRAEMEKCHGTSTVIVLADAIDRLAAELGDVKEMVREIALQGPSEFGFDACDVAVRAAKIERDAARADVERLKAELTAARAETQRIQDEADDREQTERVKRLNAEIEKTHRTLLNRTWERDIAKAEVERLKAELAARPAAAGWLTKEERELLALVKDMADCYSGVKRGWRCNWPYDRVSSVASAILDRAGSPPVVEVPVMHERLTPAANEAKAYRAALDAAGIPWKEKEAPRE